MGKNKLTRLIALVLAVVSTLTVVLAAANFDLNADGKTDVWDLQLAVNGSKTDTYSGALIEALGGKHDELHPVSEKYYEIYSALGLYNMAKLINKDGKKGYTFKLMEDIDLGGVDWTPIDNFVGVFDGNGKTISNFKITKCGATSDAKDSMGFFSVIDYDSQRVQSRVENLHLVDVEITVAEDAKFIGLLAGSNRGKVKDCTTLGVVTDNRTVLSGTAYIGTIVGRNNNSAPNGTVTTTNSMDALEYYDFEPQNGTSSTTKYAAPAKVSSMMATHFAELSYPEGTPDKEQYKRSTGIAGYSAGAGIINGSNNKTGVNSGLVWQDITNSSYYDSQTLRDRRTTVAAAMYEMSTVEWTPHANLNFYNNGVKSSQNGGTGGYGRVGGKVYRGLPYNHGGSSIYRFLAYMDVNADGRYQTKTSVPTVGYYFTDSAVIAEYNAAWEAGQSTTASGYPVPLDMMTKKLSGTTQLGYMQYIGADCSSQALMAWRTVNATSGTGKVTSTHTSNMYMCKQYMTSYGIVPVNDFVLTLPSADLDGDGDKSGSGDKSLTVKEFTRANKDYYMETLGCVTKGDLLMDYTNEGGHTLLAMSDAVVIRNYQGVMDLDKSYIVTAEQGGGGGTRNGTTADGKSWTSTCCVDEVNSFNTLFGSTTAEYPSCFFPITCAALQDENTPAATVTISMKDGIVSTNFQIIGSALNNEEMVYAQIQQSGHRSAYNSLTVAEVHADVKTGDTVKVLLSNGQTYEFTY